METKRIGAQTLRFSRPPRVESFANIGAKMILFHLPSRIPRRR